MGTTNVYGGGDQIATNLAAIDVLEAGVTVEVESTGTVGAPNSLADTESRKVEVNENTLGVKNGHLLPTAVAGLTYTFVCNHTDGIRVQTGALDTIRVNGSITIAEGYIESTVVGSTVVLVAIDATEWIAIATNGTWVVETS